MSPIVAIVRREESRRALMPDTPSIGSSAMVAENTKNGQEKVEKKGDLRCTDLRCNRRDSSVICSRYHRTSKAHHTRFILAARTSRHFCRAIGNIAIKWNIWLNIGHKLLRVPKESPIKNFHYLYKGIKRKRQIYLFILFIKE